MTIHIHLTATAEEALNQIEEETGMPPAVLVHRLLSHLLEEFFEACPEEQAEFTDSLIQQNEDDHILLN
jgi:hypothetical protein